MKSIFYIQLEGSLLLEKSLFSSFADKFDIFNSKLISKYRIPDRSYLLTVSFLKNYILVL